MERRRRNGCRTSASMIFDSSSIRHTHIHHAHLPFRRKILFVLIITSFVEMQTKPRQKTKWAPQYIFDYIRTLVAKLLKADDGVDEYFRLSFRFYFFHSFAQGRTREQILFKFQCEGSTRDAAYSPALRIKCWMEFFCYWQNDFENYYCWKSECDEESGK